MQPMGQGVMLHLVHALEVQILHHRPGLEGDALLFIAGIENLAVFNDLKLEQQRRLIQDDDINRIGLHPPGKLTEEIKLIIQKLIGFDLLHQEDGNIHICEVSKYGAPGQRAGEIGRADWTLREQLIQFGLLLKQVHAASSITGYPSPSIFTRSQKPEWYVGTGPQDGWFYPTRPDELTGNSHHIAGCSTAPAHL